MSNDQAGAVGELLVELDRLIKTQAKLQFAKENYNEALAEAYGIALLDFMRVHGMELRRIVAGERPSQESSAVAWRYRFLGVDMPWAYIDGPQKAPEWAVTYEAQHLCLAPPAAVSVEALEGLAREMGEFLDAEYVPELDTLQKWHDELTTLIKERSNG